MPNRTARVVRASQAEPFEWTGYHLTSGDISRLLGVDLKTVHNWVGRGHMRGRRTEGRHLRFARPEVVRFLREMGHPVPRFLGNAPSRAVLDGNCPRAPALTRALGKSCEVTRRPGLFACSLCIAAGQHEMVILDLDLYSQQLMADFVRAVRSWGVCEQLCLVGLTSKPTTAREFLRAGGDAVLDPDRTKDLAPFVRWLVGSERACPEGVRVRTT